MTSFKTDTDTKLFPVHFEQPNSRRFGWQGINARNLDEMLGPGEAHDLLNWANRTGVGSDDIGIMSTRPGSSDKGKYEMPGGNSDTTTYPLGPVRMLQKWFPGVAVEADQIVTQGGEVLALVKTTDTATGSIFKKWDGSSWTTITGSLKNTYFPQSIVLGLPTPRFVWGDAENGIHVYDGSTDAVVEIPKNSDTSTNITGAFWLEQLDGRLIVAGNWFDASENNILYYSASGDPADFTSISGGGSFPVYGADSRSGAAAPKRITGLAEFHGMMVVFTEDMRHVVAGIGSTQQQTRSFPGEGCFNGKMIVKARDAIYWWGKDGAYRWSGGDAVKISDPIWNKIANVSPIKTLLRGFSFVFEDQWWTTVRYKSSPSGIIADSTAWQGSGEAAEANQYYNYVYDFKDGTWRIYDIPMTAAFNSKGGTDTGRLYFAGGVTDTNDNSEFKTYTYAFDEVDQSVVFADTMSGSEDSRSGIPITSIWETGKLAGEQAFGPIAPLLFKNFEKIQTRIAITSTPGLSGGGTITAGQVQFRLNDVASYTNMNFNQAASTPYHALNFRRTDTTRTQANYIQLRWKVSGTKRVDVKRAYIIATPISIVENEG